MDLSLQTETFTNEDQSWLGSAHATDTGETVTLDAALFSGTFQTQKFVPSGVVIGKVTATGLYGPYSDAAGDGREVARFHLLHAVEIKTTTSKAVGAGIWHGQVIEAKLPTGHGLDAAAKVDLKHINYV